MIPLASLKLNERNPRTISKDAFQKLRDSVERDPHFMELRPIIIDETNTILGGNQRYRAAVANGMKDIPDTWVKQAKDLTPAQKIGTANAEGEALT